MFIRKSIWRLLAAQLGAIGLFSVLDLAGDVALGAPVVHLVCEALVVAGVVIAFGSLSWSLFVARKHALVLSTDLAAANVDAARWRREAATLTTGLSEAIDRQFGVWTLTPAEREIGRMMLKGFSFKEAADLRGVSERTVRQQAQMLYKKAGVSCRAEFSAFFLEDLLLPPAGEPTLRLETV